MTVASPSRISAVRPLWAVEGGHVTIAGSDFSVDPVLPRVLIGGVPARLSSASRVAVSTAYRAPSISNIDAGLRPAGAG